MALEIGTCMCGSPCNFLLCEPCFEEALQVEDSEMPEDV